jgi:hypothetical protein
MLKYLKTFFFPTVLTYSYTMPKEMIICKISAIFSNKVTLFNNNDMTGKFLSKDTFSIEIVSVAFTRGIKYSSNLVGQIVELQNGISEIKTKAKPSFVFYFLFFVTIILGLNYLRRFIETGSTEFIVWSLAMLVLGPTLSIGFSNVAIASIRERYKMYVDKALKA